ncbi:type I DNA topoisomerase [Candidatus Uhrbacteria bacterium]|nr:type I DNA topoisomerase [Candidatus Uhrbacteria bacterium]
MKLVIVESPTKAKTISKFLGRGFVVKSSFGHIRDLPKSEMGVDAANDFTPRYVIPTASRKTVTDLRKTAAKAQTIIFATDEDREGEAISWHLREIFKKELGDVLAGKKLERIAFHEITEEAIKEALEHPREIDLHLVDAQQARRILDRLVGYELSPLLWQKVARGLSAGRVQSVTLRLVVEREREIRSFKAEEYWTIEGIFHKEDQGHPFEAKLIKIGDETLEKFSIQAGDAAQKIIEALRSASYQVHAVSKKVTHRSPGAPLTTSTLQQEANRKLGFSAKQAMVIAQQLYEGVQVGAKSSIGLITYMRTDAVTLSERFLGEAREYIRERFGAGAVPETPRRYKARSRLAQEAHEAIRPTAAERTPESVKPHLEPNQFKLYDLIWRRALASQMHDAELETTSVDLLGAARYTFRAAGTRVTAEGHLALFPDTERPTTLPELREGDAVVAREITPKQHFTEPPARYSDASLVKALEELGIGRPSTYAPTIATLLERGYADRIEGRRLKPTDVALVVNDLLVEHFPTIVDFNFTAQMEEKLDDIAEGKKGWVPVIREFYEPFSKVLTEKRELLVKKELTETPTDEKCDLCGKPMVIKLGRYGKFYACTGFPDCRGTKPLREIGGTAPADTGVRCPKCEKGTIVERRSRRGKRFWGCGTYPTCNFVLWKRPTGEKCTTCGSLMGIGAHEKVYCSNPECPTKPTKAHT